MITYLILYSSHKYLIYTPYKMKLELNLSGMIKAIYLKRFIEIKVLNAYN